MADPKGFLHARRARLADPPPGATCGSRTGSEVYEAVPDAAAAAAARPAAAWTAASRSATSGCPLGNLIPEWNDLVWRDDWREAIERLHATNNFPEFTGGCARRRARRPACSASTSDAGDDQAGRGHDHRPGVGARAGSRPQPPERLTGKTVAVVGSGPAGLAAAQQLTRAGHTSRCTSGPTGSAGCCATASPSSRWRSATSTGGWPRWRPRAPCSAPASTSAPTSPVEQLRDRYDAVVLAVGATACRATCRCPGRELDGIHQAMEYLPPANRVAQGDAGRGPDHRRRASTS